MRKQTGKAEPAKESLFVNVSTAVYAEIFKRYHILGLWYELLDCNCSSSATTRSAEMLPVQAPKPCPGHITCAMAHEIDVAHDEDGFFQIGKKIRFGRV